MHVWSLISKEVNNLKAMTRAVMAWWIFLVMVGVLLLAFDIVTDGAGLLISGVMVAILGTAAFGLAEM